ncbi:DUF397 domain-containing protein [Actinokineospora sp.]|uniref:DUF397 domain-containing protein n=1 Tax=Actinokineospora sp. TaxID=1872133 RepID=UPI003D6A8669
MSEGGWRKSSYSSGGQTDCVEVALAADRARIRDSKNAPGPVLAVDVATWTVFVASAACRTE